MFAAQFALSHACWLISYPLAGHFGAAFGMQWTFIAMSLLGLAGTGLALWLWPTDDAADIAHDHPDLPPNHPHLREHADRGRHRHPMMLDDLHRDWARI